MGTESVIKPEESFRDMCERHIADDLCYICKKKVESHTPVHGLTGAHWDCHEALNLLPEEKVVSNGSVSNKSITNSFTKIKSRRKSEGDGAVAQKALKLGVAAIEEELGKSIFDVNIWNQQGGYRGPKWDLDVWGFHFKFKNDLGSESSGYVSCLETMTKCVKFKKLKAHYEGLSFTYTLWEDTEFKNSISIPPVRQAPLIPPVKKIDPSKKSDNQKDKEKKSN